jgi:hypothetical protein
MTLFNEEQEMRIRLMHTSLVMQHSMLIDDLQFLGEEDYIYLESQVDLLESMIKEMERDYPYLLDE